jgi:hypothetical protein
VHAARSATEVQVQDAGPSLLWAIAEVMRRGSEREPEPEPATPRSAIRGRGPHDPGRGVFLGATLAP